MTDQSLDKVLNLRKELGATLEAAALTPAERRGLLGLLVRDHWGALPSYSKLAAPRIEVVLKASAGAGVVMTFRGRDGRQKVLLGQAGPHYPAAVDDVLYTIPGGFINLTHTRGSSHVVASTTPESPRAAAAGECEEEMQTDTGPLFTIDPARLKAMDQDTIVNRFGEPQFVFGMMLELTPQETATAYRHVQRLASDPAYKEAAALRTANEESGLPEIAGAKIFDLEDVADGKCKLLHEDQRSLFKMVQRHFAEKYKARVSTRIRLQGYALKGKTMRG